MRYRHREVSLLGLTARLLMGIGICGCQPPPPIPVPKPSTSSTLVEAQCPAVLLEPSGHELHDEHRTAIAVRLGDVAMTLVVKGQNREPQWLLEGSEPVLFADGALVVRRDDVLTLLRPETSATLRATSWPTVHGVEGRDEQHFAFTSRRALVVVRAATGEVMGRAPEARSEHLANDRMVLVTTTGRRNLVTWPNLSSVRELDGYAAGFYGETAMALMSAGPSPSELTVIDLSSGRVRSTVKLPFALSLVSRPTLSPDGRYLGWSEPNQVRLVDTVTGAIQQLVHAPEADSKHMPSAVRFSADDAFACVSYLGDDIAFALSPGAPAKRIGRPCFRDEDGRAVVVTYPASAGFTPLTPYHVGFHMSRPRDFAPSLGIVAAVEINDDAPHASRLVIWRVESGQVLHRIDLPSLTAPVQAAQVSISADEGNVSVTVSSDGQGTADDLFRLSDGAAVQPVASVPHPAPPTEMTLSTPDGPQRVRSVRHAQGVALLYESGKVAVTGEPPPLLLCRDGHHVTSWATCRSICEVPFPSEALITPASDADR